MNVSTYLRKMVLHENHYRMLRGKFCYTDCVQL